MSNFNWDDHPIVSKAGPFNWDDHAVIAKASGDDFDPNMAASASTGFFGGIPFAKQIGAAGKTAMDVLSGTTPISDSSDEYQNQKAMLDSEFEKAKEANPKTAFLGNMVGGATVAPAIASLAGPSLVTQGAVYGGAQAASDSNAESLPDGAMDVLRGGTIGALGGKIAEGIPSLAEDVGNIVKPIGNALKPINDKVVNYLKELAERKAFKSINPTASNFQDLGDDSQKVGRYILDNKIIRSPFTSLEKKGDLVQANLNENGKQIGGILNTLDQNYPATFNPEEVAHGIEEKLGDTYAGSPLYKREDNLFQRAMEEIRLKSPNSEVPGSAAEVSPTEKAGQMNMAFGVSKPEPTISLSEAHDLKKKVTDRAYQLSDDTDAANLLRKVAKILKDELNSNVENAGKGAAQDIALEHPGADAGQLKDLADSGKKFVQSNNDYSNGMDTQDILKKSIAKKAAGAGFNPFSFGSLGAEGAGFAVGGLPGAITAAAIKGTAEKTGNNTMALGADWLGNTLQKTPAAFGKFASVLQQANARGATSLAATHYMLQQTNPEYREKIKEINGGENGQ